jgi:hypothetical protein
VELPILSLNGRRSRTPSASRLWGPRFCAPSRCFLRLRDGWPRKAAATLSPNYSVSRWRKKKKAPAYTTSIRELKTMQSGVYRSLLSFLRETRTALTIGDTWTTTPVTGINHTIRGSSRWINIVKKMPAVQRNQIA